MGRLRVSDHALLRFLDRGGEMDVEALRKRLERSLERAHAAATAIGAQKYIIKANGLHFTVSPSDKHGHVVTTVLEDRGSAHLGFGLSNRDD